MIFSLGNNPPLDEVGATSSNTLVAFGLRRLSRSYASDVCLDVRNSNGAIGELSFDSNDEVSTSSMVKVTTVGTSGFTVNNSYSLSTFASNGNGTVTVRRWYDQSGNARHISQTTVANQPFLMQGGNFELVDSKPTIFFPNMAANGGVLQATTIGAFYYNAVNNRGPLNIVKFSSNAFDLSSNGVQMFGSANLRTDSSAYGADCTSTAGFYGFGMANNSGGTPGVANQKLGFLTRTTPNLLESCGVSYAACPVLTSSTARSIIPIGSGVTATNILDGAGGKIISTTDEVSTDRRVRTYLNGTLSQSTSYVCDLIRHPMYDVSSSYFHIGTVNANSASLNIKFQELISFNGTNSYSERNIVERNMGKYYNINVA
jgi:hypothetical protein